MRLRRAQQVKVQNPVLHQSAGSEKPSAKGRWRIFSDIKLVVKIRKLIQQLQRKRLEKKTFSDFNIRKLPSVKPRLVDSHDSSLQEVKRFTQKHREKPRQSIEQWADQVAREKAGTREGGEGLDQKSLEDAAYHLYEKSRPKIKRPLHTNHKVMLRDYLESLHRALEGDDVRISPQSDDDREGEAPRSPGELSRKENREEFAYRILPLAERPITTDVEARVTLSFQPHYAPLVGKLLVGLMAKDSPFADLISEAKILGPSELGKRTDGAVLYLNDNREKADQLAGYLHEQLTGRVLLDHTPAGMLPLQKGIGFAETHAGDDSSFGMCRGKLIAEAVLTVDKDPSKNLPDALAKTFSKHGYDPEQPALVLR